MGGKETPQREAEMWVFLSQQQIENNNQTKAVITGNL